GLGLGLRSGLGLRLRLGRRLGRRSLRPGRHDHRELRPDIDRLAFLNEDLLHDPLAGARDFGVDLVRRDLQQRLVGRDLLALLLEPLRDRPLRDGDAHLGHDDVDRLRGGHQYSASSRSPAATPSTCGMNAFSSAGENGTGVSGAAIRFTGASRSSNASSAIVAAISPPKPPVCVSSWSTTTFEVLRTLSSTAFLSQGISVRRSRISTETPSPSSSCAASSAVQTIAPQVTSVMSSPSR